MKPQQPKAAPTNTIDNSLDEILHQLKVSISLSSKAPYPVFDDSIVGHAFDEAKDAINKTIMEAEARAFGLTEYDGRYDLLSPTQQKQLIQYHQKCLADLTATKKYGRADNDS